MNMTKEEKNTKPHYKQQVIMYVFPVQSIINYIHNHEWKKKKQQQQQCQIKC